MKNNIFKFCSFAILSLSIFIAQPASAMFDFRLGYGITSASPSDLNNSLGISSSPIGTLSGFNADAIFSPPLFPLGFGLRYESLSQSVSVGSSSASLTLSRFAALVDYRLIDTLMFLGAIGSVGLSHTTSLNYNLPGASASMTAGSTSSYSIGVEGGAKLIGWLVGGEVGYQMVSASGFTDSSGATFSGKADLNGAYAKLLVGLSF